MRVFLLSLILALSLFSEEIELSTDRVENGKTALLTISKEKQRLYTRVTLNGKEFPLFDTPLDRNKKYALLPIGYYEKPTQNYAVELFYSEGKEHKSKTLKLILKDGGYEKEEIHVDSSKVNPKSKEVQKRISQEYNEAMKIYRTITPKSYLRSPFILPLESKITSAFGKARVYNGSLKGYHSGTDFRAKVGTPIVAANSGRVALVKDRFYSGGTVLLDHGEGVYSCYFHLSAFSVVEGDLVQKGQKIGLSGESGRVTGPHLHFSVRVNGVQVDPLQLIKLLNTKLLQGR